MMLLMSTRLCRLLVEVVPPEASTDLHEAMIRTCWEQEVMHDLYPIEIINKEELKEFNRLE